MTTKKATHEQHAEEHVENPVVVEFKALLGALNDAVAQYDKDDNIEALRAAAQPLSRFIKSRL